MAGHGRYLVAGPVSLPGPLGALSHCNLDFQGSSFQDHQAWCAHGQVEMGCSSPCGQFFVFFESQKYIDDLLDTITKDLLDKKNTALNSLDAIVQSLCVEIETRLSI